MSKGLLQKFNREMRQTVKTQVIRLNHRIRSYDNKIWLIGGGRSGTTWASNLINWNKELREMFEPFHPRFVKRASFIRPHMYARRGANEKNLTRLASEIFSGRLTNRRVDTDNKFRFRYRGLLIKDIFANLMADWALEKFNDLKIILLVRNPFAVALSKQKMRSAFWMTDPADFLQQPRLMKDHLEPFRKTLTESSVDYIERQVMIWAVIHYVPLRQFRLRRIHTVFYEDLLTQPETALAGVFKFLGVPKTLGIDGDWKCSFTNPSRVAWQNSNIGTGKSPLNAWQDELTSKQKAGGQRILENFGLGEIYDKFGRPSSQKWNELMSSTQYPVQAAN